MNVLLDTHAFLWYIEGESNLPLRVREIIGDASRIKFVSIASLWEIAIKLNKQKLILTQPFEFLPELIAINEFEILPIHIGHLVKLKELPAIHADPFNRLLIAQAIAENIAIISVDKNFSAYPINVIWQ